MEKEASKEEPKEKKQRRLGSFGFAGATAGSVEQLEPQLNCRCVRL
jgi:hypothetical protein